MQTKYVLMGVGLVVLAIIAFIALRPQAATAPEVPITNTDTVQEEENTPAPEYAKFDAQTPIKISEKIVFEDGLTLTLEGINDSRCKPGTQCIWAGELGTFFSATGGGFLTAKEIRLGTTNAKSVTTNGYVITLVSATETSAVVTVSMGAK